MTLKKICDQLNIVKQCQKYDLSVWQCPQFLFLVMGAVIFFSTLFIYIIGSRYIEDPLLVALIILFTSAVLFIIASIITRSFERLAETNRMKSEFVNIVSHQLRSPLSNLKWATELLMSGRISSISEKQAEYFKILKENSARMGELVSDLLTVSRIEQGKFPLKKEKIYLRDLIEKTIKETEIFAEASNVEINFNSEDNLPQIIIDPNQIKLVIVNLLENAIRYIPARQSPEADRPMAGGNKEGRVQIDLKKKNHNLQVEVKDNGIGIPKDDQKYIFQKFFRSRNVKKHQTEGSGLGLYIVKSVIEKSGGKIGFYSQEKKGSTFWFTLPIK